jgi:DNA-binding NarL/FixJ family response regulator
MATRRGRRLTDRAERCPADLRVSRLEVAGAEFLVISFGAPEAHYPDGLSKAERGVAAGILAGKSNAAIAAARGVSVRTVANQIAGMFRKLGVSSRLELVRKLSAAARKRR